MTNILVPTDFSPLSKVAIKYAIAFAGKANTDVTLLHVINMIQPTRTSMRLRIKSLEQEYDRAATQDMKILVDEFADKAEDGITVKSKITKGSSFNEMVKKEARRLRAGLIVMSTRGASGLKKYVMGTNTASVIELSKAPVLVIPELANFKNLRNVVYATDLKHTQKELKTLITFLERFDSVVHLIHITSSAKEVAAAEKKIDGIIQKAPYKNVIVRVMVNRNVDEAIDRYVSTTKADLLTTFTHEHGFYDRLFNRSITRKIAFQSKVPLLAFKQK